MNTSTLKRFAQEARRKLIAQVGARLELVLNTDSAELRDKAAQVRRLREEINSSSKAQVIDKVAYTWFNRLMALRFMDVNDYQPLGMRVVTPRDGNTLPEILQEAKQGHIPDDLPVNRRHIYDLLDGRIPAGNAQNEAYKELLIGACNHLHQAFPFMFEHISDYTELLLPDDLTSPFSIVHDVREGMQPADCSEVEIIGWLYQFYISERKDQLINAKRKYKEDEIAPVTQLFTPKWIVQYMVDNTLGQIWTEARPTSKLHENLTFYIKPANPELIPKRAIKSPEEIRFFDPCVGSAHILCYAFDLFYKMYEEVGYNPSEIPEYIITKNLFGIDIDDRAAQLASFALMMKGRQYSKRLFRKNLTPNIIALVNDDSHPKFAHAKVFGSLIKVDKHDVESIKIEANSLFAVSKEALKKQATMLAEKYDVVVTNPPYLNSSYMESSLKAFVEAEYPQTKSDLFACFLMQCMNFANEDGLIGYISPYVWMFISSYEKLRNEVIENTTIASLIQLEYNAFEPACVPVATFTLRNTYQPEYKGSYIKLSDFKGHENQAPKTLEAIQNPQCGWFFNANQHDFQKIPGSPIGYWLSCGIIGSFDGKVVNSISKAFTGLATGRNDYYLRNWFEVFVNHEKIPHTRKSAVVSTKKWFPYNKGGSFRKWFGNRQYVVNWFNDGFELQNTYHPDGKRIWAHNFNLSNIFRKHIGWSDITSSGLSFRIYDDGFLFDSSGTAAFANEDKHFNYLLGFLNTKFAGILSKLLNPTLHFTPGDFSSLPVKMIDEKLPHIDILVNDCIICSQKDWDSHETSWDFLQNELHRLQRLSPPTTHHPLPTIYQNYKAHWSAQFFQLHQNEEELNRQFIEIYGLQDELTPDVPLEDITILQQELDRGKLKKLSEKYRSGWKLVDGKWEKVDGGRWMVDGNQQPPTNHQPPITTHQPPELPFNAKEVMAQFVSYAVGCMFGRYSLDKEGLILANQGETFADYVKKVAGEWWMVDGKGNWIFNQKQYDNEQSNEFQRAADMAASYGTDQKRLHSDEGNAQRRIVWPDESDQKGVGERAEQHSRGSGEGNQRVYPLSENSQRIAGRTGDTTDPDQGTGNDDSREDSSANGIHREPRQANQQSDQQTPLTTNHHPPSTNHQSPSTTHHPPITFMPDDDNIIPILDEEWFEDDIVNIFHQFLKATFGEEHFSKNLAFLEDSLGKDIRKYFLKDFYPDHIRRYKKRPIYWMFSSPKGSFNALIYMHRYTPDTINLILNKYLRQFHAKLASHISRLEHNINTGSAIEQSRALREKERLNKVLFELQEYERDVMYPLAGDRIPIDLDDGVLVNYNKFGKAVKEVTGLNDKKTKEKVRGFDWIDTSTII